MTDFTEAIHKAMQEAGVHLRDEIFGAPMAERTLATLRRQVDVYESLSGEGLLDGDAATLFALPVLAYEKVPPGEAHVVNVEPPQVVRIVNIDRRRDQMQVKAIHELEPGDHVRYPRSYHVQTKPSRNVEDDGWLFQVRHADGAVENLYIPDRYVPDGFTVFRGGVGAAAETPGD